jgi:hypothetical protein
MLEGKKMTEVGQLTMIKSDLMNKKGRPAFLGTMKIGTLLLTAIAEIKILRNAEAAVLLELHAATEGGNEVFKCQLDVISQKTQTDPGMAGNVKIFGKSFLAQLWVSKESLSRKTLKLVFVEAAEQNQCLQHHVPRMRRRVFKAHR